MKHLIVAVIAAFAFASTAVAAPGTNPCVKDGWAQAQSGSGQAFASQKDCQKSRDVFTPTLTISPTHVVAGERFNLSGTGFHPGASVSILFAITGEPVYGSVSPPTLVLADGTYSLPVVYAECRHNLDGSDVTVDLTITLVDSFGVHASARLVLC